MKDRLDLVSNVPVWKLRRFETYLMPIPVTTPTHMNRLAMFVGLKLTRIWPMPTSATPSIPVHRDPIYATSRAFKIAKMETQVVVKPPTKLNVEVEATFCWTSSFCNTPHPYVTPSAQNPTTEHAEITTQPYPPSGIVASTA
jgi:hypothetical protein